MKGDSVHLATFRRGILSGGGGGILSGGGGGGGEIWGDVLGNFVPGGGGGVPFAFPTLLLY